MPRFFVSDNISENYILNGENGRHAAKSLRMKIGENITLCNGDGIDYLGTVIGVTNDTLEINIYKKEINSNESKVKVHVLQCIPKLDKMDLIIQKAVELGACDITPVISSRCISQITGKEDKKLSRWNKISLEAAKQSGRGIIPQILTPLKFKDALNLAKGDKIIFYEGKANSLREFLYTSEAKHITILIGPEGGFSPQEVQLAQENDFSCLSLGNRILRTETAGLCALSIIMYEKDR